MVSLRYIEQDLRKELIQDLERTRTEYYLASIRKRMQFKGPAWMSVNLRRSLLRSMLSLKNFFNELALERAMNIVLKKEYKDMLNISLKQQWKTMMREEWRLRR